MNPHDYDQFSQAMTATMELYGKPSLSEFSLSLWWGALECYTLAEVLGGLSRHVQNPDSGQFAPKPADVVRAIGGTTHDNSAMAWAKVDRAVRSIGGYEDVVFDDAYIHAAIEDMGGWVRVCTGHTDEGWPFVQREFENRYRGYATRRSLHDYPRLLVGIANAANNRNGLNPKHIKPPRLVGDEKKAMAVYRSGSFEQKGQFKRLDVDAAMAPNVINIQPRLVAKGE